MSKGLAKTRLIGDKVSLDGAIKSGLVITVMTHTMDDKLRAGLAAAVDSCGNVPELSRRINAVSERPLTSEAVYQWKYVPLDRVSDVASATGVPKHVLRPDQHDPPVVRVRKKVVSAHV